MGMMPPVYGDFDPLYPEEEVVVTVGCIRVFPCDVRTLIYALGRRTTGGTAGLRARFMIFALTNE
jgi:hypothetical protein